MRCKMTKVIYDGNKKDCRIKVGSMMVSHWKKGEVRDIDDTLVSRLLANKDFKLAEQPKRQKVVVEKEVVRKNALDLHKQVEELESKLLEEESKWDIPTFLREKE